MPRSPHRALFTEHHIRQRAVHLGHAWHDLPVEEKLERLLNRVKALETLLFADDSRPQKLARLKYLVASHHKISVRLMLGPSREPRYVWPRHVSIWLATELLHCPQKQLAEQFNRRDHGTIRHALNCVEARRLTEPSVAAALHTLRLQIAADLFPAEPPSPETPAP